MKTQPKRIFRKTIAITALFCLTTQSFAANVLSLSPVPLTVSSIPPQIMLTITKDQQLFKKAYNDYSDLDGDGVIDRTYDHTIEYYGYFDPFKCYDYDDKSGQFEPKNLSFTTTTVKVNGVDVTKYLPALCKGKRWNGNFLNWVSMSRMDAVRKLLYGGLRSTDETFDAKVRPEPVTVLERAYIPTDAHAWAKYYLPDPAVGSTKQPDIDKLTPFNPATQAVTKDEKTNANFAIPSTTTTVDVTMDFKNALSHIKPGDQVRLQKKNSGATAPRFFATVRDLTNSGKKVSLRVHSKGIFGSGSFDDWDITNLSSTGISFCNVTTGSATAGNVNEKSQTNTNPPLIRVAEGNFALWNANERAQCHWFEEANNRQRGFPAGVRSNGNQSVLSGIDASAENPLQNLHGLGKGSATGEFAVRVKVCDPKVFDPNINAEKCKTYPNGNLKPIGLLQEYGDSGRFNFGLMTGSYAKNISGGVLRKNMGPLTDEVRTDSDGVFREANSDGTFRLNPYRPRGGVRASNAEESPPGIINTLNYMRIYGYRYHRDNGVDLDGDYMTPAGDNCIYQLIALKENECTSWGNPISEIFFEAVRYFAGQPAATPAYTFTNSGSKDNLLGLPLAKFKDPLSKTNYCAPLNVLVFNAAVADNDEDLRTTGGKDINAAVTIAALTNEVGKLEGINGKNFFVGKVIGVTPSNDPGYELCSDKTVGALGDASGICPEGPTLGGSYLISGIAHHSKTNHIRTDLEPQVRTGDVKSLKVTTYGIQLASNTPQLEIDAGGGQKVVIQPIYRLDLTATLGKGAFGGGGLVDMRYVGAPVTTGNIRSGKVYVNWEDSEQGGDYDQDMWGTIEWSLDIVNKTITVTTNAVSASTANPQGFGYSISGTLKDGPHFHSGIYGFKYPVIGGVKGCVNCRLVGEGSASPQDGPTSVTYQLGAATAGKLQDPLWYAAKFGGFKDDNGNKQIDAIANPNADVPAPTEADRENNATGAAKADGIPDNYFLVTNPLGLVSALKRALDAVGKSGAGSAVMANSTSLSTTNRIYQARYEPSTWSGQFIAKDIDPKDGTVIKDAWDAGLLLNLVNQDKRVILTFDDTKSERDGTPFRKNKISKNLEKLLDTSPITSNSDGNGDERLLYLRGDRSREGSMGGIFRTRGSVLGDIVSSDPAYVGPPNATQTERAYATFRTKYFDRAPMLYVGANDGMVHGFDAVTGQERLAYLPSATFPNLTKLTTPAYSHRFYVDGAPQTADVELGAKKDWRTVLVGGLAGGGQGLYALDVTDPAEFTESNASKLVLWEFNDGDDADLGYVYGKPVIRKMSNGKWAAIVSSGYNNKEGDKAIGTGKAYLFIIFLDGPTGANRTWTADKDYIKIEASFSDTLPDITLANGLAPPFAADTDADGDVNFVYAGDLQGNFWKFDVSDGKDPITWKSSKVILFKAVDDKGNKQPITSQAEGTLHPTEPGFILVFGTGKYLETADTLPTFFSQSYYGIWDKNDNKDVTKQTVVTDRNKQLFDQPITTLGNVRVVPDKSPDWKTHLGWRMDFPKSNETGERVVFRPLLISSRLIFTTLIPSEDPCEGGGTSFLMIVDPSTGGRVNAAVINLTNDKVLNENDKITSGSEKVFASGIQSTVGIAPTPVVVKGGPATGGSTNPTSDKIFGTKAPFLSGPESLLGFTFMGGPLGIQGLWIGLKSSSGRVSWREVLTN